MAVDDLVSAANDMYRTVAADGERTPEEVVDIAMRGSKALRGIQDDPTFRRSVHALVAARRQYTDAFQAALGQFGESREQLDRFIIQERAVLLTAGLEQGLVEELLIQGNEHIGHAREWQGNERELYDQVTQLQDVTSNLAAQLKETQAIAKALAQAAEQNRRLTDQLEQERAERKAATAERDAAIRENRRLASEIAAALATNGNLMDQLAHTGLSGRQRGRGRIFWRLTFGVGGLVIVVANAAATPLIGAPGSAASGAIGNAIISWAAPAQ